MTATISASDGSGTTSPVSVLSPYSTEWAARSIIHDLTGGGIAVSLVTPRPRAGALELLYTTEAAAFACAQLHRAETSFTLTETERPAVSMSYVVADPGISIALDEETRHVWIVTIGYTEVTP